MHNDEHANERDETVETITKIIQRAHEAQHDVAALMSLHTDDTIIVNLAGRKVIGKHSFEQTLRSALATPLADVRTTVEICSVTFPHEDTALVSCEKSVHDHRHQASADAVPHRGALTYVLVRGRGGWRIALAQTTPVRS